MACKVSDNLPNGLIMHKSVGMVYEKWSAEEQTLV